MSRDEVDGALWTLSYLTKNAGRIAHGLRLISDFDTDAKVNRYRVQRPSNERGTGFNGVYGVSGSRNIISKRHKVLCVMRRL